MIPRSRRLFAAAVVGMGLALGLAPGALGAGWRAPFRLAGPDQRDVAPARAAFSAAGDLAVGFARYDQDRPTASQAYAVVRPARGRVGAPRAVPGAQSVIDLIWDGATLELLVGGSPSGKACCSYARATGLAGGRLSAPQTLTDKLTGLALGRLIVVGTGRVLATVAAARGVWAAQSPRADRFAPTRRLASDLTAPWAMSATILASGHTFVGWGAASPQTGDAGPSVLSLAEGSPQQVPGSPRTALRLDAGHELDELVLASAGQVPLAAWIESWFTASGVYVSEAVAGDLGGRRVLTRRFAPAHGVASGVAAAGHGDHEGIVAWKVCDPGAVCSAWATFRGPGGSFGPAVRVGAIDAGQEPAVAITETGRAMVGWVDRGRVLVTGRAPGQTGFARVQQLRSSYAHDLTLAVGPGGAAGAVWTEGTVGPSVVGALYAP